MINEEQVAMGLEKLLIDKKRTVNKSEELTISNRAITLRSGCDIVCSGSLLFENCVFFCNETHFSGKIVIDEGGRFDAKNCTFICQRHIKERYFIESSGNCIAFENCDFKDCTNFVHATDGELTMKDCSFYNCLASAVSTTSYRNIKCNMQNIVISNEDLVSSSAPSLSEHSYIAAILHIPIRECLIENITVYEGEKFSKKLKKAKQRGFSGYYNVYTLGTVKKAEFKNTTIPLYTVGIGYGKFDNCTNAIITSDDDYKYIPAVFKCEFSNCSDVILPETDTEIKGCVFFDCSGKLICQTTSHSGGGVVITDCIFKGCYNRSSNRFQHYSFAPSDALISLHGGKNVKTHEISSCTFENISINEGFCINAETLESFKGYIIQVSDCEFINCYTNRNDGKIINEYSHYYGAFSKSHTEKSVYISSCKGLDKIRNDFIDDFDEFAFDEDDFDEADM